MCDKLTILEHDSQGYLAYGPGYDVFTLVFGTSLVAMFEPEVRVMLSMVEELLEEHANRVCPNAKAFTVAVNDDRSMRLVLTYSEMQHLQELVSSGLIMHETQQILSGGAD